MVKRPLLYIYIYFVSFSLLCLSSLCSFPLGGYLGRTRHPLLIFAGDIYVAKTATVYIKRSCCYHPSQPTIRDSPGKDCAETTAKISSERGEKERQIRGKTSQRTAMKIITLADEIRIFVFRPAQRGDIAR